MKSLKHAFVAGTVVLAGVGLTACAGHDNRPDQLMAVTEDRIDQAKSHEADEHAPLALSRAQEFYRQAQSLVEEDRDEEARMALEKAAVEAELAMATSQAQKTSQAALAIQRDLQLLEQQMTR